MELHEHIILQVKVGDRWMFWSRKNGWDADAKWDQVDRFPSAGAALRALAEHSNPEMSLVGVEAVVTDWNWKNPNKPLEELYKTHENTNP